MHDELTLLASAVLYVLGMRTVIRWCECSDARSALEQRTTRASAQYEQANAINDHLDRVFRRVAAARHARSGPLTAPVPMPCPVCRDADLRRACVAVRIWEEASGAARHEFWCPQCAPLIRGDWREPAPKETW